MTLIALAAAQTLADDVDAWGMPRLRALLPMAGMTVIEHQAEAARRVGASAMLLLVDGVPAALAEACDRIRARGLAVDLVRDGQDIAKASLQAERMLLVGDAIIASAAAWQAVSSSRAPILLVTNDSSTTQALERIDAQTRWAGLALLDGARLASLDRCPPDWDPQLFLFRSAVQDGTEQLDWAGSQFVSGDMAVASSGTVIDALESRVMAQSDAREAGLGRRWLMAPLVRMVAGPLLARQASGKAARLVSLALSLAAGGLVLAGHLLPGLALGVGAMSAHVTGDFVTRFRPEGRLWRGLATAGLVAQLLVLLLAERGSTWGTAAEWLGQGSYGLTIAAIMTELTRRRAPTAPPQVDLAAIWPLYLGLTALTSWSEGPMLIAMLAIGVFGVGELREAEPGAAKAV